MLNTAHVNVGPEDHSVVSEDSSMAYKEDISVLGPFSSLSRDAEPFQVIPWQASKIGRLVTFQIWEMDCALFCDQH